MEVQKLYDELKQYINERALSSIDTSNIENDFNELLGFCKKYKLISLDGSKMYFYFNLERYDVGSNSYFYEPAFWDISTTKIEENYEITIRDNNKLRYENVAKFYLENRLAKSLKGVDFFIAPPNANIPKDVLNYWLGFNLDIEEKSSWQDVKPYFKLIYVNLCGEDIAQYRYVRRYISHLLNYPWEMPRTSLVFAGQQGIGKNLFVSLIDKWIHKQNKVSIHNTDDITGFNKMIEGKLMLFADEAIFSYDKRNSGAVKNLITNPRVNIERKGVDKYSVANFVRLIIASNHARESCYVESQDRRYFVADTQAKLTKEFTRELFKKIDEENMSGKVMYYLHKIKGVKCDYNFEDNMPKTKSQATIQMDKLPDIVRMLRAIALNYFEDEPNELKENTFINFTWNEELQDFALHIKGNQLFDLYNHNYNSNRRKSDKNDFGIEMKKYFNAKRQNTGWKYTLTIKSICNILLEESKNTHIIDDIVELYNTKEKSNYHY